MNRVAILGLGDAAEHLHLPACTLLPEIEIVGVCDPDRDRRTRIGELFRIQALYADARTLLEQEKPDITIVATPPDSHRDLCLLALEGGSHVLCEKPFVRSIAEADEVIAVAERDARTLFVNNEYRFMKIYRVAQEHMIRGDYGAAFLIQAWQQMFHPPSRERNWRTHLVQSTLFEFGTHVLDLFCFFFGAFPLSITAHTPRPVPGVGADVVVQATLRFPGDRLAALTFNRISHALPRYLEMRVDCERASMRISFGGVARASVEWSRVRRRPISRFSLAEGGEARVEADGRSRLLVAERREGRPAATALNLRSLIEQIRNGGPSSERARYARELIRIVFAGYESARTGETVWLNPDGGIAPGS
ncbi:MAG: Gfo/Idh/MocA family protein [bacterium]